MKFFCKLEPSTKKVLEIRVIGDDVAGEDMSVQGEQYCANTYGGEWKQCSKDNSFRKWYPGKDWFYREDLDAFVAPQPYPSWTLNTTTCIWEPPIPKPFDPDNPVVYNWNEDIQNWVLIT
jgi:hypothetical protein